ncbi:MAG TPA: GYD domain-containing protein [Ktedonosporobacter sp.]|nr:GYD domain-containing protein [Ktedonosporobacter sp.]
MALYMVQFAYTPEALATMRKNPQDRRAPVRELIEQCGGRMVGFYYCFGEYDGVTLYEVPNDTAATAIAMTAISSGFLKISRTTKLFTVEETMEAMRKATTLTLQGPSGG